MTRFVAVFVAVGVSIAGAGAARAQQWPAGATIKFERFSIKQGGEFKEPDLEDRQQYLNLAHCTCAREATDDTFDFQYDVSLSADTATSATGEVWVGTSCDNDTNRPLMCRQLTDRTIADIDTLASPPVTKLKLNLFDVVNGPKDMEDCVREEGTKLAWILVKLNGMYVYQPSQPVGEVTGDPTKVDTKPPQPLEELSASGGEQSIEIKWKLSASNQTDYHHMQALCSFTDDQPVFTGSAVPEPKYQTARELCGAAGDVTLVETRIDLPGEAAVASVPFGDLQKEFLCGEATPAAGSLRIEDLENDRPYKVALLAMDLNGNVIGNYFTSTVTPRPVIDFWEDLHDRDSAIDGGCLLSTTYGDGSPLTRTLRAFRDDTLARTALGRWLTDAYYATLGQLTVASLPARVAVGLALAPLVALALLWHLLGLPLLLLLLALPWLWRRRRRVVRPLRLAAAAAAAALLLAPGLAAADDFMPYWEEPAQEDSGLDAAGDVKWHVGIRVGPYTPDIDLQFPLNPTTGKGPYEAMFGTYYTDTDGDGVGDEKHTKRVYQIMPMLDVDRIVWRGFGHLGVGGSLGYMQKTAYAYANGTNESQPMRARETSGENTFRLIPLAATLTYRLTYLDDRWGIPVIPYVRGGLSYYVWWMKGPTGDLSKVCDAVDPEDGMTCTDEDKAYGGTLGVQVSAGIAIRAERIDRDAARSMRNSGIQHAGFYGEVFWGRVDGFGSETKLWVGDTTWFAGANFEF
jgi:hypothetical protein